MTTLAEFQAARLDEDERAALDAAAFYDDTDPRDISWRGEEGVNQNGFRNMWLVPHLGVINDVASGRHIIRHSPARVLREVAAKRERLRLYLEAQEALTEFLKDAPPQETPANALSYRRERGKHQQLAQRFAAYEMSVRLDAAVHDGHPDFDERWRP